MDIFFNAFAAFMVSLCVVYGSGILVIDYLYSSTVSDFQVIFEYFSFYGTNILLFIHLYLLFLNVRILFTGHLLSSFSY